MSVRRGIPARCRWLKRLLNFNLEANSNPLKMVPESVRPGVKSVARDVDGKYHGSLSSNTEMQPRLISFSLLGPGAGARISSFSNRPAHCLIHFGDRVWYIVPINGSNLGDSIGPNRRAGGKTCHLSGDGNFDLDAALVVNFFKLLQASAKHVVDIGAFVVPLYLGESTACAQAIQSSRRSRIRAAQRPGGGKLAAFMARSF